MKRLWIFDFDGTLVDSEVAIRRCYSQITEELIPERLDYAKDILIGPTLEETTNLILTEKNSHLKEKFMERFRAAYDENIVLQTPIFSDVDEVIRHLKEAGDHLAILTNKRSYPTHKLIKYYRWNNLFVWVACMDDFPQAKNKTELLNLQNIQRSDFKEVYLVGDTTQDGLTANNHHINFIKVNYGYGNKQDWSKIKIFEAIDNFKALLNL
ncbi:MAG: HAD family hydrolase [Methylophilaceae bacterium]